MSQKNNFLSSIEKVLEENLMTKIKKSFFCIVGCGGVGANFAEMLVRTGAEKIALIDGDIIEGKNLNRVFSFLQEDVKHSKIEVLEKKLKSINPKVNINSCCWHLRNNALCIEKQDINQNKKAISIIEDYDYVLIAVDKNEIRIQIENICKKVVNQWFSIGIEIEKKKLSYQCIWRPKTPEERKEIEGYGTENGSFASIVMEATSVGFLMLLHHLENPNSKEFRKYHKEYQNFLPTLAKLDDKIISNELIPNNNE